MRTKLLGTIACVALLTLVGCNDRDDVDKAEDRVCAQLGELDRPITELALLDPNTATVAQVRALRTRIEAEYRDVQEATEDVTGSMNLSGITDAYNKILAAANRVTDQATLAQVAPEFDMLAGQFSAARVEVHDLADCA